MRFLSVLLLLAVPSLLSAQRPAPEFANKRVPAESGFRVFIVPDMEGMASTVHSREIIAGNEGERYQGLTSDDYWHRFRGLLTGSTADQVVRHAPCPVVVVPVEDHH